MAKLLDSITIFDPKENPFGSLSNNSKHPMKLDDKQWQSVTNYIYANMLTNPMHIEEVRRISSTKDVKTRFDLLHTQEINDVTMKAMEIALTVKFENKKLAEKLISTDNSPIYYVSNNLLLGTGNTNDGQNLYGKYLSQIRFNLRNSFKKQQEETAKTEQEQKIYNIYLAYQGLIKAIREDGNDLKKFLGLSPKEIIDKLGHSYIEKTSTRDFIVEQSYKKTLDQDLLNAIENPNILVLSIRKKEMRNLRIRKIIGKNKIIFDMYADYLLEKHYPDLQADQYTQAKTQQLSTMGWQQRNDLEKRICSLFENGMLSNRLSTNIDERLASYIIPTEQDVEEAEKNPILVEDKKVIIEIPYVTETGEPIIVYSYSEDPKYQKYIDFSPIDTSSGMLKIENKLFPSVSHYITYKLILHLKSFNLTDKYKQTSWSVTTGGANITKLYREAYSQLLIDVNAQIEGVQSFLNINELILKYFNLKELDYIEQLQILSTKGLDKKFEDRGLQDILLMTGDAKLIYNDFSDPTLGVGDKKLGIKGMNYIGEYLMKLRIKYRELRKDETFHKLDESHISDILTQDPFMKEWLKMRVTDMCKVVIIMKNYLYTKYEIDLNLNPDIVSSILDKIYQPCSEILGASKLVNIKVPEYFTLMVRQCPGFNKIGDNTIEVMWKRIAVIIYYLIQHMENSTIKNIRAVISGIELLVTKGGKCVNVILDDYENCILSAIVNLTHGIIEFNKQYAYSTIVTEQDIKTAASIILNTDVSEEIKPNDHKNKVRSNIQGGEAQGREAQDEQDIGYGEEGEGEEFFFPDDDDDEENRKYDDYAENNDDDYETDGFSPQTDMIISLLSEIEEIKYPEEIAGVIESAIQVIKTYPMMSKKTKKNRINFFATQR